MADENAVVARLASLSSVLVFKDLAPGYRIRPPTDKEHEMAVSKEVRGIREFESAFLKGVSSPFSRLGWCSLSEAQLIRVS